MRNQPGMKNLTIAALALFALSCSESSGPAKQETPSVSTAVSNSVTLHVGETVVVNPVELTFNSVLEDSRCPTDVTCVWEGNAQVEVAVAPASGDGPTFQLILNNNHGPRFGEAYGQRITLVDIRPAPVSTNPIPTEAYEIDLKVERIGESAGRDAGESEARDETPASQPR